MSPKAVCALSPVRWTEMTPQTRARREAQAGIDMAVVAANRHHEGWSETAYAFIELYCIENKGTQFTGHDVVEASRAKGVIQPGTAKAWGGPLQRAAREGLIVKVGYAQDDNRHGAPVPLWRVA